MRSEIGSRLDLVGEAETVDAAVTGILAVRPDVAVVDVHLPDGGGRAIIERVLAEWPDAVFLALSVSDAADDVVGVIRAGARGYVTKTIDADQLVDAIRPGPRRRRGVLAAPRRVRPRRVLRPRRRRRSTRRSTSCRTASRR